MKTICVYLGSACGNNPEFSKTAGLLGKEIVKRNLTLIYGGSSLGTMGLLATTVKELGGRAIGVITRGLINKELPFTNLDKLHVVDSMQERKHLLQDLADMFLVMPGGLGTLEEAFDTWSLIKLGVIKKPLGFLNIDGYYDGLFQFIKSCEDNGFILKKDGAIPLIETKVPLLLDALLELVEKI